MPGTGVAARSVRSGHTDFMGDTMHVRALTAVRVAVAALAGALFVTTAAVQPARADHHAPATPEILSVSVHGGRTVVLGPNQTLAFQATLVARDAVGIHPRGIQFVLRRPDGLYLDAAHDLPSGCEPVNATTSVCTEWFRIDTGSPEVTNRYAGDWSLEAHVMNNYLDTDPGRSVTYEQDAATVKVRRSSKLTFVASPNPVRQGQDVGTLGRLTAADWETGTYASAPGQTVELGFCATPCRTVESLRTLRTGAQGLTGTSYPATRDGSWWLRFDGTGQLAPTYSPGVVVDVQ
ncbi:hypothetical protein [Streptomyces sp. NPDC058751]|uniref:hypothetical protein n=1 Tax=Streptomyces sp. NPDC058751 TaxID=3346623 RepID=UPI0036C8797C